MPTFYISVGQCLQELNTCQNSPNCMQCVHFIACQVSLSKLNLKMNKVMFGTWETGKCSQGPPGMAGWQVTFLFDFCSSSRWFRHVFCKDNPQCITLLIHAPFSLCHT